MARLVERLDTSPETSVQVVSGPDDVCSACPHMNEGMCGRPDNQAEDLDQRVRVKLGIDEGHTGSWSSILATVRDKIDPFRLGDVCVGCRWLDLDYCTNGLAKLAGIPATDD
jgi:hypothetical protein